MINIGLIGAGIWGKNYIHSIKNIVDGKIIWFSTQRSRSKHETIKSTIDYNDILLDKNVDAVIVATPYHTHYKIVKNALLANKHVLVEKPFTNNSVQALELCKLATSKKLILMVGHLFLFHPAIEKISEMIKDKSLGTIKAAMSKRLSLNFSRNATWEMVPHDLYIADYLFGAGFASFGKISTVGTTKTYNNITIEGNDIQFNIEICTTYPKKIRQFTVFGSTKIAFLDDTLPNEKKLITINHFNEIEQIKIRDLNPLEEQLKHFITSVDKKNQSMPDGYSGYKNVKLIETILDD